MNKFPPAILVRPSNTFVPMPEAVEPRMWVLVRSWTSAHASVVSANPFDVLRRVRDKHVDARTIPSYRWKQRKFGLSLQLPGGEFMEILDGGPVEDATETQRLRLRVAELETQLEERSNQLEAKCQIIAGMQSRLRLFECDHASMAEEPTAQPALLPAPVEYAPEAPRRKRALIVGLLGSQQHEIRQRAPRSVDLYFKDKALIAAFPRADLVLLTRHGASHSLQSMLVNHYGREKVVFCNTSITFLVQQLHNLAEGREILLFNNSEHAKAGQQP